MEDAAFQSKSTTAIYKIRDAKKSALEAGLIPKPSFFHKSSI